MDLNCCVCRTVLPADKRKRKRLHGESCREVKQRLQDIASVSLESLVETSNPNAYLCSSCERQISTINSLETKLTTLKSAVKEKLSLLHSIVATPLHLLRKRSAENQQTQLPVKHVRLSDTAHTSLQKSPVTLTAEQTPPTTSRQVETPSPAVQVNIPYAAGARVFHVRTPIRKQGIKRLARRNYKSLASTMVNSTQISKSILTEVSRKIKKEMKDLSSDKQDSILRDTVEAVKHFHWETVALELESKIPTLLTLLKQILPRPVEQKPLLCLLASQLLKSRHQRMGLVQRAVSVMLYGNGSSKEVYMNLQPLNVCMSYDGTLNIVDKISEYHDVEVQFWGDELKDRISKAAVTSNPEPSSHQASFLSTLEDDALSSDDASQYEAPAYSPLSEMASAIESEVEELLSEDDDNASEHDDSQPQEETVNESAMDTSIEPPHQRDDSWWCGYKFVGDNVDKNVKPSLQRQEIRGQSLHYFHAYAVKDRVNLASLSESPPARCTPDPTVLLPSAADISSMREEMCILLSRIIVQHMDDFKDQKKQVLWHIPSKYAKEMGTKSEVIPLGVQLHNENKLDEMCKILEHLMTLVPTMPAEGHLTLPNGSTLDFDDTQFFKILLGGDQLTAARVRGTQALRDTEDKAVDRLEGITAVTEDWHTRMALMKTVWQRLYSTKSTKEKATMYQLRNLINRTSIPSDPADNMNAAEDFVLLLLHTHAVAAAEVIQSINPTSSVSELSRAVVASFTRLPRVSPTQEPEACEDGVQLYAVELLSLTLLWHGFHDAIREGDGERIVRYWKFLLIIFKSSNHPNYAKEAVHLLLQHHYLLSERQKAQLLWSRCVNTKGRPGTNIPCDLHMEHLNRRLKTVLRGLGANITPKAVVKAGKSIAAVQHVCQMFGRQTSRYSPSDYHSYPSFGKDFSTVLNTLREMKVFVPLSKRQHDSFKLKCGIMEKLSTKELVKKVQTSINQIYLV